MRQLPNHPRLVSKENLFVPKSIRTLGFQVAIDPIKHQIALATKRGVDGNTTTFRRTDTVQIDSLYYSIKDRVYADDIYTAGHLTPPETWTRNDMVAFLATVQQLLTEKQEQAMRNFDLTWEWQRIKALNGQILNPPDPNKGETGETELLNVFSLFNMTQPEIQFNLWNAGEQLEKTCQAVHQMLDDNGAIERTETLAFCSPVFYDNLVSHPVVRSAFKYLNGGEFLVNHQRRFQYQDITWVRYGGNAYPDHPWIENPIANIAVKGIPDLYITTYAPADFAEAVGRKGLPFYFKPYAFEDDRGFNTLAVTCATSLCTLPSLLVKLTATEDPNSAGTYGVEEPNPTFITNAGDFATTTP